jgi:hypothetical protein
MITVFGLHMQSRVINTVLVCEAITSQDCYDQYFNHGNRTCVVEGATMLQKKEAELGVFWLGKPATQQHIDAAAAGFAQAVAAHQLMLQQRGRSSSTNATKKIAGRHCKVC